MPIPPNVQAAYTKGTRDKSGLPGKNYWQNKADYQLKVAVNPLTRLVSGNVVINYTNNSPDTLRKVVFKLYPNLYKTDAMRTMPVDPEDLNDGVAIKTLHVNDQLFDSKKIGIRGTNMYVKGVTILPHQQVRFDLDYAYTLNKGSFIRTGQIDSGAFFIAYFFPRVAVYDDLDGWNEYPYTGHDEFYNDYGDFKAEITVPGNYQVWATGDLQNANDVFTPAVAARFTRAVQSDGVTDIITENDLKAGNITRNNANNTWKFEAANVTDFAFAMSDHYVWKTSGVLVDSATGRRTRVDAVFNPDHKTYLPVVDYARKTVSLISDQFPGIPFPYSHETIFDGLDAMEYPMMVNNLPFEKPADVIEFTAHEVFHTLFPFYVGTNETKYAFMDEGWATMSEFTLHPLIDHTVPVAYNTADVGATAGTEQDVPIMTLTPQLYGKARYANKDMKPALGYAYVKEMLGDSLFKRSLLAYIHAWAGKHPTPYDFFNCMNTASGQDLNWFWQNWFFEKQVPDLAIMNVNHHQQAYTITIRNVGGAAVPVHLTVIFTDGSTLAINKSIACWKEGNKTIALPFSSGKWVKKVLLGNDLDADANKSDNTWELKK